MPANALSRFSVCAGSLTNAKQVFEITDDTATDALAALVPDYARLHKFEMELTTIAGGATSCIWNLAKDAAGNRAITPETTSTLVLGAGSAASAGFAALLDTDRVPLTGASSFVSGSVFLVARLNAGTAAMVKGLLYWVR